MPRSVCRRFTAIPFTEKSCRRRPERSLELSDEPTDRLVPQRQRDFGDGTLRSHQLKCAQQSCPPAPLGKRVACLGDEPATDRARRESPNCCPRADIAIVFGMLRKLPSTMRSKRGSFGAGNAKSSIGRLRISPRSSVSITGARVVPARRTFRIRFAAWQMTLRPCLITSVPCAHHWPQHVRADCPNICQPASRAGSPPRVSRELPPSGWASCPKHRAGIRRNRARPTRLWSTLNAKRCSVLPR